MHVLLVEDDPVAGLYLNAALKGLGYDVTATTNGAEAWSVFRTLQSAVVISDWSMPEMDGAELCRRIRARPSDRYTYFILVTSTGGDRKSTRLNSSHGYISYAVFCLKKKKNKD